MSGGLSYVTGFYNSRYSRTGGRLGLIDSSGFPELGSFVSLHTILYTSYLTTRLNFLSDVWGSVFHCILLYQNSSSYHSHHNLSQPLSLPFGGVRLRHDGMARFSSNCDEDSEVAAGDDYERYCVADQKQEQVVSQHVKVISRHCAYRHYRVRFGVAVAHFVLSLQNM